MMFSSRINAVLVVVASVAFFVAPACGPRASTKGDPVTGHAREEAIEYLEHRVRVPGETLSLVAEWYTGSADNWMILAEHNPALDPRKIELGDAILVPELMLIRRDPPTESFVAGRSARKQRPPAAQMKPIQPQPDRAPAAAEDQPSIPEEPSTEAAPEMEDSESLEAWQKRVREVLEIKDSQDERPDPTRNRKHELLEELLEE